MAAALAVSVVHVAADDFPKIYNSEPDQSIAPMDAQEAASKIRLPPGFKANVFAAEPEVQNPIAMSWDDKGRLWVAENYTYSERTKRFDLSLRDRVVLFEDRDQDGRAETRHVFLDQIQMLTSVEIGRGGVWLMCPPQLLFVPDANSDAIPDGPAQVVLDGFEVARDNYHNFANGLKWGPDGWLYGRCGHSCPGRIGLPNSAPEDRIPIDGGVWRYHPDRKVFEALCHGTTNPWGHDWDKNGELFFINTVIGHLWHLMPGSHLKESFGESMNPFVFERMDMIADHYHFDTKGSWSDSRGGKANDLGGGHAHIGATIYQGTLWPASYRDRLFTLNMHGLRANVERLERHGAGYIGYHEPDFGIAADPFFRGIDLNVGPDGNMYVIDWSDTGECHEHTGVHRTSGRIFRIAYGDQKVSQAIHKPACMAHRGPLGNLWRDYQAGVTTESQLIQLLDDPDEALRVWAVRLLTDTWPLDTILGPLPRAQYPVNKMTIEKLRQVAKSDSSGLVQLALASTLQRLPLAERIQLASAIAEHAEYSTDRDLPYMVWFGIMPFAKEDPGAIIPLIQSTKWPQLIRWTARAVATHYEANPAVLDALLVRSSGMDPIAKEQLLIGLSEALRGARKATKPPSWNAFVRDLSEERSLNLVRDLNALFGDGRALEELRKLVLDNKAEMKMRQQALLSLIEARPPDLRSLCQSLLDVRILNGTALQGIRQFDDLEIGKLLASKYRRFQTEDRIAVLEVLVSRKSFTSALLDVMEQKDSPIAANDLNAFHARQILQWNEDTFTQRLTKVWGKLHDSPAEKQQEIARLKSQLVPEALQGANLSAGRSLFNKGCSQCHMLYGQGAKIGPDITGAQRSSLDYLLENILDPSAVVGKDYRMTILETEDGRTVSGLLVSNDGKRLHMQTQTSLEVIPAENISQMRETSLSPMPDGLLNGLSTEQIRDLIAYLMHPSQVPIEN